ncbi:MAG TPA: lysophospholipid acyltransferase family protein [Planctomycetota bacterium]|nr:lysophospholipid acyltransferase family protein [Planctomycetota bacterium]
MTRLFAILYFRARFEKVERVPRTGPVILAANHQSLFDPCLVGISFKRRASFLARETLFRVPVLGWLIRKLGAFPVPRESTAPRKALEVCVRVLELGRALVLFPEGTRTRDGRMQPLRRGVAQLAQRTGAPVVPVIIQGAHAVWPRKRRLPRPGRIRITFGEPLRYEPEETYDSFMERLMSAYLALAGEAGAGEVLPLPFVAGGGPASSAGPSPTSDEGRGSGPQARVASRAEAAESPPRTTAQPSI